MPNLERIEREENRRIKADLERHEIENAFSVVDYVAKGGSIEKAKTKLWSIMRRYASIEHMTRPQALGNAVELAIEDLERHDKPRLRSRAWRFLLRQGRRIIRR